MSPGNAGVGRRREPEAKASHGPAGRGRPATGAALDETRPSLERLVVSMGQVAQRNALRAVGKAAQGVPALELCRRYLLTGRLLNNYDIDLLLRVLSIATLQYGPPDAAWCDVTRHIIGTTVRYLLLRYEGSRRVAATADT